MFLLLRIYYLLLLMSKVYYLSHAEQCYDVKIFADCLFGCLAKLKIQIFFLIKEQFLV